MEQSLVRDYISNYFTTFPVFQTTNASSLEILEIEKEIRKLITK